jgi:hypothetical protein
MRITSGLMLALLATACGAQQPCARTPLDEHVERGRDLLIGEMHGTVESPELVRCLVLVALRDKHAEPLVVSLEQIPSARDMAGDVWKTNDGRSSIAMWDLAQFLFQQEKAGLLTVAFHMPEIQVTRPEDLPDAAAYEKLMGIPLRELAQKAQLIALVGNFHSSGKRPGYATYDPAGVYVGESALHVRVDSVAPGTMWNQMNGQYAKREGGGSFAGHEPNTLVPDTLMGHDFVYLVSRLTASAPKYP